jgi:hypothetical protein
LTFLSSDESKSLRVALTETGQKFFGLPSERT